MLTSLPRDVLVRILSLLDTKNIATAATACTVLRDAAALVPYLKPIMTPQNRCAMMAWLDLEHVRHRVISLRISRALKSTQYPALTLSAPWITGLTHLRSMSAAFCRLPVSIVHCLPSTHLMNLHIHQLLPGVNDVFSTRLLSALPEHLCPRMGNGVCRARISRPPTSPDARAAATPRAQHHRPHHRFPPPASVRPGVHGLL